MEKRASRAGSEQRRYANMSDLKHQAAEYYRSNEVPQRLEEVLNAMFYQRPDDFYGHLANYFSGLSKPPVICRILGNRVLDGTGRPTLEVEVFCRVKNFDKRICSSTISSHAEILENASPEAVDAVGREISESLHIAFEWISESLNEMLKGLDPTDQHKVDELLCEFFAKKAEEDKERRRIEKEKETPEATVPVLTPPAAPAGKKKSNKPACFWEGKDGDLLSSPSFWSQAEPQHLQRVYVWMLPILFYLCFSLLLCKVPILRLHRQKKKKDWEMWPQIPALLLSGCLG